MDIGIGLPSTIPGTPGRRVLEWARAAEKAGFSTLGTLDRLVYGNLETVPTLAAAAAVTERIGLTTAVLIAPYRGNGALLAKQLATVDSIAEGRLRVGIAVGGRADDYEATDSSFENRGRTFERQLAEMRAVWAQEPRGFAGPIGPAPVQPGGPPLLIGGDAAATARRIVEFGAGWILGAGGPDAFAAGADRARRAWDEGGREGEPRLVAIASPASATTPSSTRSSTSATTTPSSATTSGTSPPVPSQRDRNSPVRSPASRTRAATN